MPEVYQFADRADAGRRLADVLAREPVERPVILAIPRGGVAVGTEIAARLGAELDLLFVRKIGAPWNHEVAIGAVAGCSAPQTVFNSDLLACSGATRAYVETEVALQIAEIDRQRIAYLGGRSAVALEGRNVIVTDDGVATGATLAAGLKALRLQRVHSITLAIPVAPPEAIELLSVSADRVVCLLRPHDFRAVGPHYLDFAQVSDGEVIDALTRATGYPDNP
ncbi:phosphoribosyltransferase [Rhizobium sp. ARZ01]|uniref:phosphoribosyltransferase n=1 Tax=Rhizobium sp. ARZ01 TaxID=2769313 RepID=UPI00178509EC|nr:phosphoribosyltransferase family protein [Rhizobium sp. ARZ01]MBD9374035.1 phosphoribosyltransferase [Rhizobium sp. ARZ01]